MCLTLSTSVHLAHFPSFIQKHIQSGGWKHTTVHVQYRYLRRCKDCNDQTVSLVTRHTNSNYWACIWQGRSMTQRKAKAFGHIYFVLLPFDQTLIFNLVLSKKGQRWECLSLSLTGATVNMETAGSGPGCSFGTVVKSEMYVEGDRGELSCLSPSLPVRQQPSSPSFTHFVRVKPPVAKTSRGSWRHDVPVVSVNDQISNVIAETKGSQNCISISAALWIWF